METTPQTINVFDPDGTPGSIPKDQLQAALQNGFRQASPEDVAAESHSGIGEQALGLGEEAARSGTFGLSTGLERGLSEAGVPGLSQEDIAGREHYLSEHHPILKTGASLTGLVGSSLVPVGEGALLARAGEASANALGLTGASTLSKIGSAAVKGGIETALFQSGDEVHKMLSGQLDPDHPVQTALLDVGLSGLLGAGAGGAIGSVSPLWKATAGGKVSKILQAVQDRAQGIEGKLPDEVQNALSHAGMDVPPEVKSALSNDPYLRQAFQTLQESTTESGVKAQQALKNVRDQAGNSLLDLLGKTPEDVSHLGELSQYDAGKRVQENLYNDLKAQYEPISELFKTVEGKFKEVPLSDLDQSKIGEKIGKLIQEGGYYLSPSSPSAKVINTTLDELGGLQTLDDVRKYTSILNEKTNNPDLYKIGGDLRRIFRGAEQDILSKKLSEEAPELFDQHALARTSYGDMMNLVDQLNDRLHVGRYRGMDTFLSALKEMSPEDVLRRMSGKGDADLLKILSERFPKAAGEIKDFHVNSVLKSAAAKAVPGEVINPHALFTAIGKLPPELVDFAMPEAGRFNLTSRFDSIKTLLDSLPSKMNTSGTAKTIDALWSKVPGSAVGMAAMLLQHNPIVGAMGFVLSPLVKFLGRDVPDAARLAMLKFMGSPEAADSEGFKAAVDWIHSIQKGEKALSKASKAVFEYGAPVVIRDALDQKDREKLEKKIESLAGNPNPLFDMGGKIPHYLPDHGESMAKTAGNALNILNQARPKSSKMSPLDSDIPPSKVEMAAYQRLLQIAERPLTILDHVKNGSATPQDIKAFHDLYPALYQRMSQKLVEEMTNRLEKEKPIPYSTRMGLSLFLGQPMDSTMTPQSIMATQAAFQKITPSEAPQMAARQKHSMNALKKLSQAEQTPSQAREMARLK